MCHKKMHYVTKPNIHFIIPQRPIASAYQDKFNGIYYVCTISWQLTTMSENLSSPILHEYYVEADGQDTRAREIWIHLQQQNWREKKNIHKNTFTQLTILYTMYVCCLNSKTRTMRHTYNNNNDIINNYKKLIIPTQKSHNSPHSRFTVFNLVCTPIVVEYFVYFGNRI